MSPTPAGAVLQQSSHRGGPAGLVVCSQPAAGTRQPSVKPLSASLRIFADNYYGAYELLVGEAIEFAKRAKDAGVDVRLHPLPEGQHNFVSGAGRVPEVDQAIEEIARWLRSRLGLAASAAA